MDIPRDFKCAGPADHAVEHHVGFAPMLLESVLPLVQPLRVWCPACGYMVPGSTKEAAVSNWNDHVGAGKTLSIPEGWKVLEGAFDAEWHHAGVTPQVLQSFDEADSYAVFCPKCGLLVKGSTREGVVNLWNATMEAGPRYD